MIPWTLLRIVRVHGNSDVRKITKALLDDRIIPGGMVVAPSFKGELVEDPIAVAVRDIVHGRTALHDGAGRFCESYSATETAGVRICTARRRGVRWQSQRRGSRAHVQSSWPRREKHPQKCRRPDWRAAGLVAR